jgi:hypothetical protein
VSKSKNAIVEPSRLTCGLPARETSTSVVPVDRRCLGELHAALLQGSPQLAIEKRVLVVGRNVGALHAGRHGERTLQLEAASGQQ